MNKSNFRRRCRRNERRARLIAAFIRQLYMPRVTADLYTPSPLAKRLGLR